MLVTEPAWNTPANRERMAEIMFEEFHVPAFYISNTSVLNAYVDSERSQMTYSDLCYEASPQARAPHMLLTLAILPPVLRLL